MIEVVRSADCGNSPKNRFVEDMEVSFALRETGFLLEHVTDDVCWNVIGEAQIRGKGAFRESIEGIPRDHEIAEITIDHVVTHGKVGAVNGRTRLKNGATYGFCSIYEFANTKGTSVRTITSYAVPMGDGA